MLTWTIEYPEINSPNSRQIWLHVWGLLSHYPIKLIVLLLIKLYSICKQTRLKLYIGLTNLQQKVCANAYIYCIYLVQPLFTNLIFLMFQATLLCLFHQVIKQELLKEEVLVIRKLVCAWQCWIKSYTFVNKEHNLSNIHVVTIRTDDLTL